jgi:hypothetical protein
VPGRVAGGVDRREAGHRAANPTRFGKQRGGATGGSAYPLLRLVALVTCGTRTVIDAVYGPISIGETGYARLTKTFSRTLPEPTTDAAVILAETLGLAAKRQAAPEEAEEVLTRNPRNPVAIVRGTPHHHHPDHRRGGGVGPARDGDQLPAGTPGQPARKLEPDPGRPRYLVTEPGIGYRFTP